MTERELFAAAAAQDMPDFDAVRDACLAQKIQKKRPFRYRGYLTAAACFALILIAVPVMRNFGSNASDGAEMSAYSVDSADADSGEDASGAASGDTAGNTSEAMPEDTQVGKQARDSIYTFNRVDAAPEAAYYNLAWDDFSAMTAAELEEYFGAPLLPLNAPEGYTETTDENAFGIFKRKNGEVYYDSAVRTFEKDGGKFRFATSKHTLLIRPDTCAAAVINGYSVELFAWDIAGSGDTSETGYAAYYSVGDVNFSVTGENVTEDEFMTVLLAQIGD